MEMQNRAYSCGTQEKRTASLEKFQSHQDTGQRNREEQNMPLQTDEQRGKRACALTARGSISNAMKGLVGGAATGTAEHRRHWTTALILRNSGRGKHLTDGERAQATRVAWRGARYMEAHSAMREQGRSKTCVASLPQIKLAPTSAPGPTGERQEHLADAETKETNVQSS